MGKVKEKIYAVYNFIKYICITRNISIITGIYIGVISLIILTSYFSVWISLMLCPILSSFIYCLLLLMNKNVSKLLDNKETEYNAIGATFGCLWTMILYLCA